MHRMGKQKKLLIHKYLQINTKSYKLILSALYVLHDRERMLVI